MRDGMKSQKIFAYAVLVIFFITVVVFGLGGYYAGLGSDPYGIVHFADHLARGKIYSDFPVYNWFKRDWEPGESHFVLHGNYVLSEGKMFCKYTIGFPLLLAVSINILGSGSVYYANVFILLILLWFHFKLARIIFSDHPDGLLLSVLSPILLMVMISRLWSLSLRPSRDLSALMFIVAGCYLGIMALRRISRINFLYLISGAFCLGFSASIRLPNVLVGLPAIGYLMARMAGKVRFTRFVAVVVVALLFFSAALGPAFIQNYLSTGNSLKPPRPEIVERDVLEAEEAPVPPPFWLSLFPRPMRPLLDLRDPTPPPFWLGFFKTTAPDTAAYFWRLYGPLFAVLILIGLSSEWRKPEVKFLLLGIPLIFVLFYSMWVHLMIRYMLIAQPFLIILAVGGIGRLIRGKKHLLISLAFLLLVGIDTWFRWRWRYRFGMEDLNVFIFIFAVALWISATWNWKKLSRTIRLGGLSLVVLVLFTAKYGPVWAGSNRLFQLPEARRLGEDIDQVVEEGSVIFATKPAANYISLFSESYSIRPFEMNRVGVDQVEGLNRILDEGVKLYLIDSSGWKRDATKAIPGFREYYDVIPAGRLNMDEYFLEGNFGKPVCTIYRIKRWSEREVEVDLPVPEGGGDYLLMLNVGHLWEGRAAIDQGGGREWVTLDLNGNILDHQIKNNINFIRIPEDFILRPVSRLTINSDRPLPSRIDFRLQSLADGYVVELAEQLGFPDRSRPDGFSEARLRDGDLVRLGWDTPGLVVIPTVSLPNTVLTVEIKVKNDRNFPEPVWLKAAISGQEIFKRAIPRGLGWQRISIPIPERYISSVGSNLELTAYPSEDHRLTAGEERTGALLFEEIAVVRKIKTVLLPTPRSGYYFLGFSFQPGQSDERCLPDYRILVDGKEVRSGVSPGVQRLILSPDDLVIPESVLEVTSLDAHCDGLIDPRIILFPLEDEITINLGDETDRIFIDDGFFAREIHMDKIPVRWTGPAPRLTVPLPLAEEGECYLRIKVVDPGPPRRDGPDLMEVKLDGQSIGSIPLEPGERVYSLPIPSDEYGGEQSFRMAELELTVPLWSPAHYLGTADKRQLGVMLDWIKLARP